MFIPDPRSRILDPKTATKERDEKKFDVIPFYDLCSQKFHKIVLYFSFQVPQKKLWANFKDL
jgi:hypothetical protein